MKSYRVFISYSHEDLDVAERIVRVLEENGLVPMWDKEFLWGHGFPEQIKNFIAHAHVFTPLITESSSQRGWVHQEIGYDKVKVAIHRGMPTGQNITIVGDWFVAEAVSASLGEGYRQTIFTRHAPTVQAKIALFDQELEEILRDEGIDPASSRAAAVADIEKVLKGL